MSQRKNRGSKKDDPKYINKPTIKNGLGSSDSAGDNDESSAELEFQQLLEKDLSQWDASIHPDIPSVDSLEQLIVDHKQVVTRHFWRDLLILWVVGGCIVSGLLLLLQSNIVVFAIFQASAFVVAAIFLVVTMRSSKQEGQRKWNQ